MGIASYIALSYLLMATVAAIAWALGTVFAVLAVFALLGLVWAVRTLFLMSNERNANASRRRSGTGYRSGTCEP